MKLQEIRMGVELETIQRDRGTVARAVQSDRQPEKRTYLQWVFMHLMLLSERRGPYATGMAIVNRNGSHEVFKRPVSAREFLKDPLFGEMLGRIDDQATVLMGHTRWPTRGSHLDNRNNHPLLSECNDAGRIRGSGIGICMLTHNGHIENAGMLFRVLGVRRETEVDSEILLRLAEMNLTKDGIDPDGLAEGLSLCRGRMSCVVVATNDPTRIILVKGNQPLEFRYSRHHQVLFYASEAEFLGEALGEEKGWVEWQVPPMRMIVVSTDDLAEPTTKTLHLGGLRTDRR